MTSKLTPSSKKISCGVCGDTTGKCRSTEHYIDREYERGLTVGWVPASLCMVVDATKDEVVGEYVCTGRSSDDLWTRFLYLTPELQKLRESWRGIEIRQLSDEEIAQQEARQRQREEEKGRQREERRAKSLSSDKRHQLNSQILDQLSRDEATIADLQRRGFSDEEIERSGFKSVAKWQRLNNPIDVQLPGISQDGLSLLVGSDGYLCPIFDIYGRITGLQLRLHESSEGIRYKWVSSSSQTLALPDTMENPLAILLPQKLNKLQIGLSEGVGAKPFLASQRLGIPFIGAPGGLHASSPQILRESIQQIEQALWEVGQKNGLQSTDQKKSPLSVLVCSTWLKDNLLSSLQLTLNSTDFASTQSETNNCKLAELQSQSQIEIILTPDAGSTQNKNVVKQYQRTVELLHNWGYSVWFAWWGQTDKSSCDIDELGQNALASISYISSKEFFSIAALGVRNAETKKEQEQKILEKEDEFKRLCAIREKLTKITETPYKVVNIPTLEDELESLIEPGTVNVVISATGTGKSKGSRPIIDKAGACSSWHNRLALAESTATDLNITFKNEKSGNLSRVKKIAACSPSMISYNPQHLRDKGILFFDECDQVADFSFSDICNRGGIRPLVLTALENQIACALSGGGNLLALSADVTQKEIDYFRALTPDGVPFRYIVNDYQPKRGTIHLDNSGSPDGLVDELIQKLKRGERCFVLDDLKNGIRGCKSIAEYIRKNIPEIADKIIEIHADNVDDPRAKAFRNRADEESKQYLCVICSPSIVGGISIVNQLFIDGVFVFAQGILTDRSIKQFINRVRGAQNIYMWITEEGFPPRGISKDLFTHEEIRAYFKRNYEANSKHIMSMLPDYQPIDDEWHSPHFALYCKNLSYQACTMKYLKRFTIEHLQQEGYTIVDADFVPEGGTQDIEDALKMIWGNIEIAEALAIAKARFLSPFEMETLQNADNIPPELLPAYKKTQLRETFGEMLIEATTFEHKGTKQTFVGYAAMALKNVRNEYARCLDNFWLLSQDVSESISKDYRAEARQMKHGERFPGDIRWNTRRRKFHEWVGLKDFLKAGEWWEPKDFRHVAERAKSRPKDVKDAFNYTVSDVHDNQLFDELIRRLGLKIKTKSVKGQKWKLRSIDEESWTHCKMYVQYRESLKVQEPVDESIGVAQLIAEAVAEDRETYEAVIDGVAPQIVEGALQKVSQEVRDRIAGFYVVPEPVQMCLSDIAVSPSISNQSIESQAISDQLIEDQSISNESISIKQDETIYKVDSEIQTVTPLFTPREDLITWCKRLDRAMVMGADIAKVVYQLVPQPLLETVWQQLTVGVQTRYADLFASG